MCQPEQTNAGRPTAVRLVMQEAPTQGEEWSCSGNIFPPTLPVQHKALAT